jgi:ubiquinone/menaquinone biosynthesis C-methylase UbiE
MREINLLESFPKSARKVEPGWKTEENKKIAKRYDKEFFDGDRVNGYGGYYYDGRWKGIVRKLQELYGINSESAVLDLGCAKGFLLSDLQDMIPGIKIAGMDISNYAINKTLDGYANNLIKIGVSPEEAAKREDNARKKVLPFVIQGSVEKLPWPDKSFDVVLNINTMHNLDEEGCRKCIAEMKRVCRNPKQIFIQVDSYRTLEEKERMKWWILTAETFKGDKEWLDFFEKEGFDGDYFWTIV